MHVRTFIGFTRAQGSFPPPSLLYSRSPAEPLSPSLCVCVCVCEPLECGCLEVELLEHEGWQVLLPFEVEDDLFGQLGDERASVSANA